MAGRFGHGAEPVDRRPGPFGIHVVGGHRRHATPVVDAGAEERTEVVGEVRWDLQVDVGGEDEPGQGDGVEVVVGRARAGCVHRGAGLGKEVLDDDLLHVAVAAMRLGDGLQRVDPVGA